MVNNKDRQQLGSVVESDSGFAKFTKQSQTSRGNATCTVYFVLKWVCSGRHQWSTIS